MAIGSTSSTKSSGGGRTASRSTSRSGSSKGSSLSRSKSSSNTSKASGSKGSKPAQNANKPTSIKDSVNVGKAEKTKQEAVEQLAQNLGLDTSSQQVKDAIGQAAGDLSSSTQPSEPQPSGQA